MDVRNIVQRAVDEVRIRAESARVNIELDVESVCVMADEDRLVQALTNLAENGIKFSPADAILQIGVAVRDGAALFCVQDHGRGIPSNKIGAVFNRFEQVDASDSRAAGGTGLGLAITRRIVELHGGRIWVESTVGGGSTFCFTIPQAVTAAA